MGWRHVLGEFTSSVSLGNEGHGVGGEEMRHAGWEDHIPASSATFRILLRRSWMMPKRWKQQRHAFRFVG